MANEKIYVVTQGDYSDYHIIAATTDREIAEKISTKFTTRHDECRIEEYGDAEAMLRPAWIIGFEKTGNVISTRKCDSAYDYSCIGVVYETESCYRNYHMIVIVSADDSESAVKIAAEKRAKYLAEKQGL